MRRNHAKDMVKGLDNGTNLTLTEEKILYSDNWNSIITPTLDRRKFLG